MKDSPVDEGGAAFARYMEAMGGLDRLADAALFTGEIAVGRWRGQMVAVVPDLFEITAHACDLPLPDTLRLTRTDGRAVRVYNWPAGMAVPT